MITPENNESQRLSEPVHLEAEGYLNRALRRLGEGLGCFVFEKIQDKELLIDEERSIVTRDLSIIFGKMEKNWARLGLGPDEWNYLGLLIGFRNGPWAHMAGYSDYDVHDCLGYIRKFLKAVSADEQAQAVDQMWGKLGKLLFSQSTPERPRDSENVELRQRISDLEKENLELQNRNSQISGQVEGFQYVASLMALAPASVSPIKLPVVPDTSDGTPSVSHSIAPDSAEDFLRRGNEARRKGYIEDALTHYNRAIELNPLLAEAYVGLGNAYMDGEEYELAIADYSDALRVNPDNAAVYFYRGFAYATLDEYGRAISDYSDALRLNPVDTLAMAAYGNRGNVYRSQGEYDQAIDDYDAALRLNPNGEVSAGLYFNRGYTYLDKGEHDQAIADFSEALRLDPDIAEAYDARGFAYFIKEKYDLAVDDFDIALQIDPDDRLARILRGHAYFNKGDYDLAIDDCSVAIELNPDLPFAFIIRALAFGSKDEHDRAIADYESALAQEPDDDLAELAHKGMRLSQGSKDLAARLTEEAEYDQHIAENPRDPQNWHLTGLYFSENRGDYGQAIHYFDIAIAIAPDDASIWNDRGWAWWRQGEDDLAYDDYSQAIALKPDYANAYYNRAWVWRRRGNHRNAIIDFSQAIALKPDYAAAYQHRGISYFDIGDRDNAQADFEAARSLGYEP
jgi:tetratricopeptide (TPR) repeat protein